MFRAIVFQGGERFSVIAKTKQEAADTAASAVLLRNRMKPLGKDQHAVLQEDGHGATIIMDPDGTTSFGVVLEVPNG